MPHVAKNKAITNARIKSLKPNGKSHQVLWDSRVGGLGLRVRASGRHVWLVRYRDPDGNNRRKTLGPWTERERDGAFTIPQARTEAQRELGQLAGGGDVAARRKNEPSLEELWERFLDDKSQRLAKETLGSYRSCWDVWIAPVLGRKRKLASIAGADVFDLHDAVTNNSGRRDRSRDRGGGRHMANRVVATLSSMMSFAGRRGMLPRGSNPCRLFDGWHKEVRKRRFLGDDELVKLLAVIEAEERAAWAELESLPPNRVQLRPRVVARVSAITGLRVLMLTAGRPSEILGSRWEDVDLDAGVITLQSRKTGVEQNFGLALPPQAVSALKRLATVADTSGWVVASRMYPTRHLTTFGLLWARLRTAAGLPTDLTPYVLRRTAATTARHLGISMSHTATYLGHANTSITERAYAAPIATDGQRVGVAVADHYDKLSREAGHVRH
ncbi:MAG: integrase family protein [Nannocystaceae bacterium]|nr:integrase family protein [Nannocystaceae bacterium]